jgi:glucose-6-phosphate 1-dehydrogenase
MTARLAQAKTPPLSLVMFGASGDLTARKLLPALASLADKGSLAGGTGLIGVARTKWSDDEFRDHCLKAVPDAKPAWAGFASRFRYVSGNYDDDATFERILEILAELDSPSGDGGTAGNRLFYLATIPALFGEVARGLARHGLNHPGPGGKFARLVI